MNELVTVVVPIYNVEKYLERCLKSVTEQTYKNLEIILVDDGATDSCPEICEEWAKKDNRIKVVHKENAGLGMARNTGIENASGDYICFFDSDDYVDVKTIEKALGLAKKESAEVVAFGMKIVDNAGNINEFKPESQKDSYSENEVTEYFLPNIIQPDSHSVKVKNVRFSACSCLFKMKLVDSINWRFVSEREMISEDEYSLLLLYKYVSKVAVLQESLYYYCENSSSLTHTYRKDRYEKSKHCYQQCVALCKELGYPAVVEKACMSPFIGNTVSSLKQAVAFYKKKSEAIRIIREIIDDETICNVLRQKKHDNLRIKNRIFFWAIVHKQYRLCYWLLSLNNNAK